jgi:hypothetical protein
MPPFNAKFFLGPSQQGNIIKIEENHCSRTFLQGKYNFKFFLVKTTKAF